MYKTLAIICFVVAVLNISWEAIAFMSWRLSIIFLLMILKTV